jgi:hypothetical protein
MKDENAEDGVRVERFFGLIRVFASATLKPGLYGRGSVEQGFRSQCGKDDQAVDRAAGPAHENEIRSSRIVRLRVEQSQDWTE